MANSSYIELPTFSDPSSEDELLSSIIVEEGLEEADGIATGFVTEPVILNVADDFYSSLNLGTTFPTTKWNLYHTNSEESLLEKSISFVNLGFGENDTSFVINAGSDPDRFPFDTNEVVEEPGIYIAKLTMVIPGITIAGMTFGGETKTWTFEFCRC